MTYRELLEIMQCMTEKELDNKVIVYCEDYDYHYPADDFVITSDENSEPIAMIVLE